MLRKENVMTDPTLKCPNCSTEIKLTESLAAPLIQSIREEYERKISAKEEDVLKREQKLVLKQKEILSAQKDIEKQVAHKLSEQKKAIILEEKKKAQTAVAEDLEQKLQQLNELQSLLDTKNKKLADAQKVQAEMLRKERALEDAQRELELTVENRVKSSLEEVRAKTRKDVEENLKLKVSEKEEQIASMQRQIDDLKRKAEQGSQQLQGEVLELELEQDLRTKFPFDVIDPIGKGEFGGDILHKVVSANGQSCGTLLWETKRTRNWSEPWLAKLRNDQRIAKADICILMTHAMPKGVESFELIDGVWVTKAAYAIPLVSALRQSLIELYSFRQSREGQNTKMEMVYDYLTGAKFRHRVEAIVEKVSDLQSDLDKERKMMMKSWAKRETQIKCVIDSTVGMYGDLQGIAGRALKEIDGLDMAMIEVDEK